MVVPFYDVETHKKRFKNCFNKNNNNNGCRHIFQTLVFYWVAMMFAKKAIVTKPSYSLLFSSFSINIHITYTILSNYTKI